ncbi:ubiquitin C-terminal hydrolase 13-like isoform X5 [Prosopis cineraria]|uniref:ubiquitin C-terminal hydrolase 13-like isoform X5 n=1 Tax=Prosopis cineraria TaxID=364024 RepID=UPI0024106DBF|nr:ubiquitin C-terminal hydrolase 13-like isoform X5 [Prosopis cineraria]
MELTNANFIILIFYTWVDLSHPDAEVRLLEVFSHKIYKIFPLSEKIETINDQYWTLRAEEIPEEEKKLGPHDRLIHVYHFITTQNQDKQHFQNLGDPFLLMISEGETLAEVKLRIQKKLRVPDEEFSKKRDIYGDWEQQYLGLEHTDHTAPKRFFATNQVVGKES